MNAQEQMENLFQALNSEAQLSTKAVSQFNQAIERVESQETVIKQLGDKIDILSREANLARNRETALDQKVSELTTNLDECWRREQNLIKRENHQCLIEMKADHHAQRVDDHQEMFRVVFKNTEVKRSVHTFSSERNTDGYGNTLYTDDNAGGKDTNSTIETTVTEE